MTNKRVSSRSFTPRGIFARLPTAVGGLIAIVAAVLLVSCDGDPDLQESVTVAPTPTVVSLVAAPTTTPTETAAVSATNAPYPIVSPPATAVHAPVVATPEPAATLPPETVAALVVPAVRALPVSTLPFVRSQVDLRAGPGMDYPAANTAMRGESLTITGISPDGQWFALPAGQWIRRDFVENPPDATLLAVVTVPLAGGVSPAPASAVAAEQPALPPPTQPPPTQTPQPVRTLPDSTCECNAGDTLNCSDFPPVYTEGDSAQACYLRCKQITGRDVHGLDGNDNDGNACEWSGWN